jgi:hypothetical protein
LGYKKLKRFLESMKPVSPVIQVEVSYDRQIKQVPYSRGNDRLFEKILFYLLRPFISMNRSKHYFNAKGRGRHKAVAALRGKLSEYRFVYKTDVHSYYSSINLLLLFDIVEGLKIPSWLARILYKYLLSASNSTAGTARWRPRGLRGILKGSPVSVLLGEAYLQELDTFISGRRDIYYQRFVDDIIILAKSGRSLRRAIRDIKQFMRNRELNLRHGKTYIGKTTDVVLYLGFRFRTYPDGTVRIEGPTRESRRESRLKHAERALERGNALRGIKDSGSDPSLDAQGLKQDESPVSAVLCSVHGSTSWYAVIPEYKRKMLNVGDQTLSYRDDVSPEKILAQCDDPSSFGVRYVKVIGDSQRIYPKVVSYVPYAREKVPRDLLRSVVDAFGEEAGAWGRKGV